MTDVFTNVFEELEWRGLVYDSTEGTADVLTQEKVNVYIGFDPTVIRPLLWLVVGQG